MRTVERYVRLPLFCLLFSPLLARSRCPPVPLSSLFERLHARRVVYNAHSQTVDPSLRSNLAWSTLNTSVDWILLYRHSLPTTFPPDTAYPFQQFIIHSIPSGF